jgi:hypothetical protein
MMAQPVGITDIELAFYNMGRDDKKLQEYFFTYYSQKLVLLNHFYPHVKGVLPGFTDHGPEHIIRIMKLYKKMLKNNIPTLSDSEEVPSGSALNFYEIYLLLCATVWHDVGNLFGRDQHNEKISDVINRLENNFFVDKDMEKYAIQIAKAHTGEGGVGKKISLEDTDYQNAEICLRFLGALLRFADELEEGEVRMDNQYYESMKDQIPNDQKIYWETSRCIKRVVPNPDESAVKIRAKISKNDLFKLFAKDGKEVALIDELVFRVDKMNQERIYYMEFVRKYIYYNEIVFDLVVENASPETFTFRFDNDHGYDAFWNNYPTMNPKNEIDGYILQKEVEK